MKSKNYVLIDNCELVRVTWNYSAKLKGIKLSTYDSVEAFINDQEKLPKTSSIYIDYHLGQDQNGITESIKIAELGFTNIFLCTGSQLNIDLPPRIKGRVGKMPVFN